MTSSLAEYVDFKRFSEDNFILRMLVELEICLHFFK